MGVTLVNKTDTSLYHHGGDGGDRAGRRSFLAVFPRFGQVAKYALSPEEISDYNTKSVKVGPFRKPPESEMEFVAIKEGRALQSRT